VGKPISKHCLTCEAGQKIVGHEPAVRRLSLYILIFSILFAVFFIGPPFLSQPFVGYPLMKTGDLIDILTPLILVPLYWLLFCVNGKKTPSLTETIVFLLLVAFWVEGQGMHLSANSIGHLLKEMKGSNIYILANFYDEVLSHYLWHFGIIGLSGLIIFRQWQNEFAEYQAILWLLILSGIIHGFTFFLIVIEGGTAPLGITFAAGVTLFGLVWGRKRFKQQPLLLFFFITYLVATLFFAGWGIYWRGLPEFSQLGII
jgi:hypothetical protein